MGRSASTAPKIQKRTTPEEGYPQVADIDTLLEEMPPELRATLAHLNAADDHVAGLTLALLPFGSRSALVGCGIIQSEVRERSDQPVEVRLTPFGREVIAACALHATSEVVEKRLEELDEAHARRAAAASRPPVRAVPASAKGRR
jgi:hypothetical protein